MSETLFDDIYKNMTIDTKKYAHKEFFLDNYWSCEVDDLLLLEPKLCFVFGDPQYSGIAVCIAGKETEVDFHASCIAKEVINNLPYNLSLLGDIATDDWVLASLLFPYQIGPSLWYATFMSEYGATNEFAFIRGENKDFSCHSMWSKEDGAIYNVMPNIKFVIDELSDSNIESDMLIKIKAFVLNNKTIGLEIIMPLIDVIESNKLSLGKKYEHIKSFLAPIKHHAKITTSASSFIFHH